MGVMRDELRERLADAAKFLRRCRGTEPVEFFEEHATACEEAAALLARQEAREGDGVSRVLDEVEALADNWHPGFTPMEASRETVREIRRRLAAARPAPETEREPELLGYVVERQLTTGEWMRVWRGRTMWFDHDEAVLERDAYALDGIPARIRGVYLGASAPAEATERCSFPGCGAASTGKLDGSVPLCDEHARAVGVPASGEPSGAEAVVRAAHQERDADAQRLARRLANATPPSLDYPNGYTRLAERFHAILTDAAMAADTQTEGDGDGPV